MRIDLQRIRSPCDEKVEELELLLPERAAEERVVGRAESPPKCCVALHRAV
jgi:hypothetical protein